MLKFQSSHLTLDLAKYASAFKSYASHNYRLELADGDNVRAIGTLNDALRAAIKTQKPQIIGELKRREFDALLSIVAPAIATKDLSAVLTCFLIMAWEVSGRI